MLLLHAFVYCLIIISMHFMRDQCEGVVLQQIDPCEYVTLLVQVGHVYLVYGSGLVYVPSWCQKDS